jgi:hypothetical protein
VSLDVGFPLMKSVVGSDSVESIATDVCPGDRVYAVALTMKKTAATTGLRTEKLIM